MNPGTRPALLLRSSPVILVGLSVVVLLVACRGSGGASSAACGTTGGNVFPNPGFEQGPNPWVSLMTDAWGAPFSVSQRQARSGGNSALLELRSDQAPEKDLLIFGVVRDLTPEKLPETISGYYYVERWEQGTPIQYLQFAVVVDQAENRPEGLVFEGTPIPNHQIRYHLTQVGELPIGVSNAQYVKLSEEPPKLGQWVYFERNLCDDFKELWGDVPKGFKKLRVAFEARYEGRLPDHPPSAADVFFDDLYLGPAEGNPNRPPGS